MQLHHLHQDPRVEVSIKPYAFRLLSGEAALSDYQFGAFSGHHRFCRTCGVHAFRDGDVPAIGGAFVSITWAASTTSIPRNSPKRRSPIRTAATTTG